MSKRIARPSAAPVNSARSVAIAIASAWIQRKYVVRPREAVAADLGQVLAGRDPELRGQRLDDHRHQVRGEHDPEERVAELRPRRDVRREVARVDVGDRRDERRPEERRQRRHPAPPPGERALGRLEYAGLSRKRVLDSDDAARGGSLRGTLLGHVTPMPPASSREMACSAFPTRTVSGPPNGSARPELHLLARDERELRQVAQQLVVAVRDAFDRGLVAGLEAGERAQLARGRGGAPHRESDRRAGRASG